MLKYFVTSLILILAGQAYAKLVIPKNLSASDEYRIMQVFGVASAPKIIGNPYPLGGYTGLEVSLSNQILPTQDISSLGSKVAGEQSTASFAELNIGKGLYENIDVYLNVSPLSQYDVINTYGGQIRWGFYEFEKMPLYFSLMAGANSANFQNLIVFTSTVIDLIAGYTVDKTTMYLAVGTVQTQGQFVTGITSSGTTDEQSKSAMQYTGGVSVGYQKYFAALEYDKYFDAVYALKLGARF